MIFGAAIIVLLNGLIYCLYREAKQTRLRDMQQIDDIRKSFNRQVEYIDFKAGNLSSVIKAKIELTYAERHDEIMQEIKAVGSILNEFNSQLSTLNSQLVSIETPIKLWGEAQIKNEIKKGEANRTLRRKLQENREYINSMEQSLQQCSKKLTVSKAELEQAKAAARDIVDETMKEISLIRSWMDERGVPHMAMDNYLSREFKGNVPSWVYARTKNEQALQESIREVPLSN